MPCNTFRDVGGVEGLHLALNVFSGEVEKRLFNSDGFEPIWSCHDRTRYLKTQQLKRIETSKGAEDLQKDLWCAVNAVKDCGLSDSVIPPDRCDFASYPEQGEGHPARYVGKSTFGDVVVGVTLGRTGTMFLHPTTQKTMGKKPAPFPPDVGHSYGSFRVRLVEGDNETWCVELDLPPRSIWVMEGPALYEWKHGMRRQTIKTGNSLQIPVQPWNFGGFRRSLTFKTSIVHCRERLKAMANQGDHIALLRWELLKKIKPQDWKSDEKNKTLHGQALKDAENIARHVIKNMDNGYIPIDERFLPTEVNYKAAPDTGKKKVPTGNTLGGGSGGGGDGGSGGAMGGYGGSGGAMGGYGGSGGGSSGGGYSFGGGGSRSQDDDDLEKALALSLQDASSANPQCFWREAPRGADIGKLSKPVIPMKVKAEPSSAPVNVRAAPVVVKKEPAKDDCVNLVSDDDEPEPPKAAVGKGGRRNSKRKRTEGGGGGGGGGGGDRAAKSISVLEEDETESDEEDGGIPVFNQKEGGGGKGGSPAKEAKREEQEKEQAREQKEAAMSPAEKEKERVRQKRLKRFDSFEGPPSQNSSKGTP